MRVADWMARNVPTATPGMAGTEVRRLVGAVEEKDVRWLPVLDGERIVGLVALHDLGAGATVREVMRSPVPTIEATRAIEEAGLLLLGYELEALPVHETGEAVGLITKTDVLHALLQLRGKGPLDIAAAVIRAEEDRPSA